MSIELDLDDVAATSSLAASELADLRASAARLALDRAEFRMERDKLKDAASILVQALEEIAWQRPLGVRPSKSGEAMERAAIIALDKYNSIFAERNKETPR